MGLQQPEAVDQQPQADQPGDLAGGTLAASPSTTSTAAGPSSVGGSPSTTNGSPSSTNGSPSTAPAGDTRSPSTTSTAAAALATTSSCSSPAATLAVRKAAWKPPPKTADFSDLTIEAVVASDRPVLVQHHSGTVLPEVLLMSGFEKWREEVPLLEDHERRARAVVGRVTNFRVEGGQLVADVRFSQDERRLFSRAAEGMLSLSIGYRVFDSIYIQPGDTKTIEGRDFEGPCVVATRWTVQEVSIVALPADETAQFRTTNPKKKGSNMHQTFDGGLDAAQQPVLSNRGNPMIQQLKGVSMNPNTPTQANTGEDILDMIETAVKRGVAQQQLERAAFAEDVRALCEIAEIPDAADEILNRSTDIASARRAILDYKKARQAPAFQYPSGFIEGGPSQRDKHLGAMRDGLLSRSLVSFGGDAVRKHHPKEKRAAGWQEYSQRSLLDIARDCLELQGVNTRRMSGAEIAQFALTGQGYSGARNAGWHTQGHFPSLVLDALNKTLLMAYEEAPATYKIFKQGPSVPDFKNIHRVRLGEIQNLSGWSTNVPPDEFTLRDEKETYAVEARSARVSISWKLVVNDDMSALSRIPAELGRAAARTVNAVVWSVVTSNPTLQDGQPLFSAAAGDRKKSNVAATPGGITMASLGTGLQTMRLQTGINTTGGNASDAILNIEPRYLVVPAALEVTAKQAVLSAYDPLENKNMVYNPFHNMLQVVTEPLLDANSATAWYLFASTATVETIEYTFLQGQEQPVITNWVDPETWAINYMCVQSMAAAAIDFRGCYKNAGA